MPHKNREKTSTTGAPQAASPENIRNVAIVGHTSVGKTTLVEELLATTGAIDRAGSIAEGNTVGDHDPAAIAQQRSVAVATASLRHGDTKINLLDTPGHADFVGELRAGLRAADAALFVVSAVNGLDLATQQLWEECAAAEIPRAVAITRLDHPQADFDETVALCQRMFGEGVLPVYLPLLSDDGQDVSGLIGLITRRVFDYSHGHPPTAHDADVPHLEGSRAERDALIEGIIAESEDEYLMEQYLAGEDIGQATLIRDLETAVARGSFFPVVPVNATTHVGLDAVLELIEGGFPSPHGRPSPAVTDMAGEPLAPLECDPNGPLAAEVVKTSIDAYLGRVSLVRVFSGTLRPDSTVHVAGHGLAERGHPDHDVDERVSHVYVAMGSALTEIPSCVAGDICALTKSTGAHTGDTISAKSHPLLLRPWPMPDPLLPIAVVAPTRADEDAMAKNLGKLAAADPTLRLERSSETHQVVLWCMGEAHAEVVLDRLRAGGTQVDTEPVKVALRETFTATAPGTGKHVKQSGGHGQFGVCHITVEPLSRGSGFEFVDKIVGGVIGHQFIASVEKGVRSQMERGLLAGYPVIDIRVTLHDGKTHSVDSSDAAFQAAGSLALREAGNSGQLAILEPIHEVAITVAGGYVGAVMSDLSSRRGRVLGNATDDNDRAVVHAEIPAIELLRYAIDLRSLTAGSGTFSRKFARYETMPTHAAGKLAANPEVISTPARPR